MRLFKYIKYFFVQLNYFIHLYYRIEIETSNAGVQLAIDRSVDKQSFYDIHKLPWKVWSKNTGGATFPPYLALHKSIQGGFLRGFLFLVRQSWHFRRNTGWIR